MERNSTITVFVKEAESFLEFSDLFFSLKRTKAPTRVYKGGNVDWFDDVDANGFSVIEVSIMRKELDMLSYVHKFKLMEVFIEHPVDTYVLDTDHEEDSDDLGNGLGTHESEGIRSANANVDEFDLVFSYLDTNHDNVDDVNVGLGNDIVDEFDPLFSYPDTNHDNVDDVNVSLRNDNVDEFDHLVDIEGCYSEDSDDSEDSDFECDIEDQINDVHVDMEIEIDSDKDEVGRKKALKKLAKCHKHVNVRAECKGVVPVFSNSRPSGAGGSDNVGLSDGPNGSQTNMDKPTGLDSKMKRQKRGIIPALTKMFPCAEHRCATATTISLFNRNMEELRIANKEVYDWLKLIPPQHWARSYFFARPHYNVLLNNMCEVLNKQLLDGQAYHYMFRVHKRVSDEKDCHTLICN
ncbi:hypothetical protein Tco_0840417 [Tanacetum coccineum]|uniref:Transposase n=1 Tax=Tanacetum coccineum TaxID=301880 RepID=A0ABQ5AU08_9ASTR